MGRTKPNVLISGTPGTGKTTTAEMLASQLGYKHVDVAKWCGERQLYTGYDDEFKCHVLDEEALLDSLEDTMAAGGVVVDYHGAELFPERWFQFVVVLRTDNAVLFPRLEARGYSGKKLEDNMECEIMQVILEEAREAYDEAIVFEMRSDTIEDMERNVAHVQQLVLQYMAEG